MSDALALYDLLDIVEADFMLGAWKGAGFPTGHPLDGMLEAYHWHGKRFESADHVHPLVFNTVTGGRASINPALMPISLMRGPWVPKSPLIGKIFQLLIPLMSTRRSRARLRMTEFRGKVTATMAYDDLPIHDVFRKVDANTVLGIMDLKGMTQPFFFVLRRE